MNRQVMDKERLGLLLMRWLLLLWPFWYYHTLVEVNQTAEIEQLNISRLHWMKWDIAIKILGIILSLTIFPAAEIVSVLITLCALVIPNQFRL